MPDNPNGRLETPYGVLYKPRKLRVQIPVLFGAFAAGPALGWIAATLLGGLSENARVFLFVPFTLVFFFGYGLWSARLKALAFSFLGKGLLRALFQILIRRKKPRNLEELLPTREKLLEMAVRAQRASSSFAVASIPVAVVSGLIALLIQSESGPVAQCFLVAAGCIGWGCALTWLGRRGYLPIMEEES